LPDLHKDISLKVEAFENSSGPEGGGILITNPPYGERLKENDIIEFIKTSDIH
jgi:23S rRNA G2445 N2-methylase RlmL